MKQIQPMNGFWLNGQFASAVFFKMYLGFDDLTSVAKFYYEFLDSTETMLANGNFELTGKDYENWDGTNAAAWNFAVTKFALILDEK